MNLKLQTSAPSHNDIFEGKSHKSVSSKMAETIKNTDIEIIGLEGELGTGKSTIINFLMDELKDEYHFITFDAERYHYGSTKKSLIEIIYKGMSTAKGVNKSELEKYKDKALGNVIEYEKKVNSRISWWTVLFILCSLLSVQMIRYLLLDINQIISTEKPVSAWIITFEAFGLFSPCLLLLILFIANFFCKKQTIGLGDLFKRNSTDTISEKWLINREVGTLELTDALQGFTQKETISESMQFILVIDNLDRISGDKVKELWSDMELIAGVAHEQFRVIVPYSARQVAKSLEVEGHSGHEFIAKRIPISFNVPPLISAGWQTAFLQLWKETVSDVEDDTCCLEVAQLLERWQPAGYPQITPRLMKKLVNDIYILSLTVPSEEPNRHVLIALYILVIRYNGINVRNLLKAPTEGEDETTPISLDDVLDDKLNVTIKQLNKIFGNDTTRWSEYLMSVHYQTEIALARSELIDDPLIAAIGSHNSDKLQELISLWGFKTAWERCSNRFTIPDWFIVAAKLPDNMLNSLRSELLQGAKMMDTKYALNNREDYQYELSHALSKLVAKGYITPSRFMERQHNFIISDLDKSQLTEINEKPYVMTLLNEADLYSGIFGHTLLDKMSSPINGEFYVRFLMNNTSNLDKLDIENSKLDNDGIDGMLRYQLEDVESGDIFIPEVLRHIKLSTLPVTNIIADEADNLPQTVRNAFEIFKQRRPLEDLSSFRRIIFHPAWHTENLTSLYAYQHTILNNYPIEYAAHKMAHMVAINNYSDINSIAEQVENKEFPRILSNYFSYSNSFNKILSSLVNEDAAAVNINAIKLLFSENKIGIISTVLYAKTYYPLLKNNAPELDLFKPIADRMSSFIKTLNYNSFIEINHIFIKDIVHHKSLHKVMGKFIQIVTDIFDNKENWHDALIETKPNVKIILKEMKNEKKYIRINDIRIFSDWYRDSPIEQIYQAKNVHLLWSILDENQRTEIIKNFEDIIHERDTIIERRVALIHHFPNEIGFTEPENTKERRAIAALFTASRDDKALTTWLDRQSFHFSKWLKSDSDTVVPYIIEHQDNFPTLCSKSIFIKERMKEQVLEE